MNYLIYVIIAVVGIWLGRRLAMRRMSEKQGSLDKAREAVQLKKEEAKRKILDLFVSKDKISNNDVEKMLGVSDATATNYLEELENEVKIIQNGDTGRGVFYTQLNG